MPQKTLSRKWKQNKTKPNHGIGEDICKSFIYKVFIENI